MSIRSGRAVAKIYKALLIRSMQQRQPEILWMWASPALGLREVHMKGLTEYFLVLLTLPSVILPIFVALRIAGLGLF